MTPARTSRSLGSAILTTGLVAGVLDGLAAIINYTIQGGRTPQRIFKFIASGVFGPSAISGGTAMVVAGVCFHLAIAMIWTAIFFMAARRLAVLYRNVTVSAVGYGLFVWCGMNLVVLPLSRVPQGKFNLTQAAIGAVILMICIGLPVSFGARRHFGGA
jgi:hypothetical protein